VGFLFFLQETGALAFYRSSDMPWLNRGRLLKSDVTQASYKVLTSRVAQGGFGEVYRGCELDEHRDPCRDVAIKVSLKALAWHGEAYFGRLLAGQPNVVQFIDAFPLVDGVGAARLVKYVLVLEWMGGGTVEDYLRQHPEPWEEEAVVEQMIALLEVLRRLHHRSICHGDITPGNVFVQEGELVLGDLGIAKQTLEEGRPIPMDGATPDAFTPPGTAEYYWSPAEDVYQLALLGVSLLQGRVIEAADVSARMVRGVDVSPELTAWLIDALGAPRDRFRDADEALLCLRGEPVRPSAAPPSLEGQRVVLSGTLPGLARERAEAAARRAGATVQREVNGATTVVIAGVDDGKKLFDARRRIRRGQRIAIINVERFNRLLEKAKATRRRTR
jgi:serine/threonine protein kinase